MSTATDGEGEGTGVTGSSPHPPPILLPPRANAIATLLTTDDFLPGAQTMLYSLKENLKTPKRDYPPEIIVLVTPSISAETRTALFPAFCTRLVEVDPITFPLKEGEEDDDDGKKAAASSGGGGGNSRSHVKSWNENCGLTKLHIFGLDVYDTILYIDADCLVIKDVTSLLSIGKKDGKKQRGALVAASPDIFPPDKFNAGVMVLRPSSLVLEDMLLQCKTVLSYDGGDTGFLNAYFSKWYSDMPNYARLSFGCNAQRFMFDCTYEKQPNYWDLAVAGGGDKEKLTIVHYSSSPKPWEDDDVQVLNGKEGGEDEKGKEMAMSHLNEKDVEKLVETRRKKKKDTKLDKLWQTWYEQSTNYASQFRRRQIEEEERKKRKKLDSSSSSAGLGGSNQQRQPSKASALESHKVITKRYQELRKGGMSTKDAMAAARAEFGADKDDDHDDPGKKVAAMFGMQ